MQITYINQKGFFFSCMCSLAVSTKSKAELELLVYKCEKELQPLLTCDMVLNEVPRC